MKRVTKIMFEPDDRHLQALIMSAHSLVGGPGWSPDDPREKPFRRIRGNDFTMTDLDLALATIEQEAARIKADAMTLSCPFPEMEPGSTRIADTWRSGLVANAEHARRIAHDFRDRLTESLGKNT